MSAGSNDSNCGCHKVAQQAQWDAARPRQANLAAIFGKKKF
jgi:hypothetical protein